MDSYSIIKWLCKKNFLVGAGNFWFEDASIGDDTGFLYKTYGFVIFLVYASTTILEIMAALIGDFSDDEKRDSVTFAVSHTVVMVKLFSILRNKQMIRDLNRKMVKVCEEYTTEETRQWNYKSLKMNMVAYVITVYGSAACFIYEGVRKMFNGSHFVTVVTYYPAFEDNSILATILRFYFTLVLLVMMVHMILTIDSFTMTHIIMFKYKFLTLRNYFDDLKKEFDVASTRNLELAAKKLTNGFVIGIIMHAELLSMSKDIDKIFGFVMAFHVCQTFGSCVSLLLQIASLLSRFTKIKCYREVLRIKLSDDLTFVASMKIIFFVIALFFLLGLQLCNAGELTYQAALVSDSIFYCGWHACPVQRPPQRAIRPLVLFATTRAQQPLCMKAFKMLPLTYGTFILVVRSTYSVFALFYAQNQ